jgi:hypothetical protein
MNYIGSPRARVGSHTLCRNCFGCVGINITFRLEELLELRAHTGAPLTAAPTSVPGIAFAQLLISNDCAFEELYVVAFNVLDRKWLHSKASYMQFPMVLDATMLQLQDVLMNNPQHLSGVRQALHLPLTDH